LNFSRFIIVRIKRLERTLEIYVTKGNPNSQMVMKASYLIILKMKIYLLVQLKSHHNDISYEKNHQLVHINVFTAFNKRISYVKRKIWESTWHDKEWRKYQELGWDCFKGV